MFVENPGLQEGVTAFRIVNFILQMGKTRVIIILSLLILTAACGTDYGHEVHGEQLTVYFTHATDQEEAENIARFWKDNNLLTGKKQDIQLTRKKDILELRLIMNEPNSKPDLPFVERRMMMELQDTLGLLLDQNIEIILCNGRFETVLNLNE